MDSGQIMGVSQQ
jgi:hypothetical protein